MYTMVRRCRVVMQFESSRVAQPPTVSASPLDFIGSRRFGAAYSSGLKTASDKHAAHSCQGLLVDKRHFCSNKNWPCTFNQAVHAQMATVHGVAHGPSLINTRAGSFVRVPKIFIE